MDKPEQLAENYAYQQMKVLCDDSIFTVSRSDIFEHHVSDFLAGYNAAQSRIAELEKEIHLLREKEIRGDRMIVDLEHTKTVLTKTIKTIYNDSISISDRIMRKHIQDICWNAIESKDTTCQ